MKIKFKLLIVLFSLTIQSIAFAEPKKLTEESSIPYFFIILIVLLLISNLITLFILFSKRSDNNNNSESLDYDKTRNKKENFVQHSVRGIPTKGFSKELQSAEENNRKLVENNISLKERVDVLTSENNSLHEKFLLLEQKLTDLDTSDVSTKVEEVNDVLKFIPAACKSEGTEFFLKESKVKNHTTPYVIFESDNEFYFQFDESNSEAKNNAFNFHYIYLEGFVQSENARTDAHTSFEIVNKSVGKLKKEGDKYLVVERIKVNYLGGN